MGQYVKDLSFENPNAPASLRGGGQPQIDVAVDVRATPLEQNTFEVELVLNAKGDREGAPLFIAELTYGGMFLIENMDERARDAFLLIEGPRLLFPFARRILADATRDGGFPPLMLEPIDFAALYRQKARRDRAWRARGRWAGRDSLIRRFSFRRFRHQAELNSRAGRSFR
jgi:preprotein translocase subunit SecB